MNCGATGHSGTFRRTSAADTGASTTVRSAVVGQLPSGSTLVYFKVMMAPWPRVSGGVNRPAAVTPGPLQVPLAGVASVSWKGAVSSAQRVMAGPALTTGGATTVICRVMAPAVHRVG